MGGFPLLQVAEGILSVAVPGAAPVIGIVNAVAGPGRPASAPSPVLSSLDPIAAAALIAAARQVPALPAPPSAAAGDLAAQVAELQAHAALQDKKIADLTHALSIALAGHALLAGVDPRSVLPPRPAPTVPDPGEGD